jgi:hypothetical protein
MQQAVCGPTAVEAADAIREISLYHGPDHVGDFFTAHSTPGLQADVQINRHVDSERFMGHAYDVNIGPRLRVAWLEWDRLHAALAFRGPLDDGTGRWEAAGSHFRSNRGQPLWR